MGDLDRYHNLCEITCKKYMRSRVSVNLNEVHGHLEQHKYISYVPIAIASIIIASIEKTWSYNIREHAKVKVF